MGQAKLRKELTAIHLWAIAVGLVISGEYFGWNYGWSDAGTIGFLLTTFIVSIFYGTFIFSFTELTTSIPEAGGPFAYAFQAFGKYGGAIAGYATLIEFLFATPAIAFALGSYAHFLYPPLPVTGTSVACYVIFTGMNLIGVKESASFSLLVTILAIVELLIYLGIVAPHFSLDNFTSHALPFEFTGVLKSLPFAIWFFLAIEGVAMVAEEVKNPDRNLTRGYLSGLATLALLAFGVMILTGGIGDWRKLASIDYPLPEAIGIVLGKDNSITKAFATVGLFGLVASFHGIIMSYSRQIFALARAGLLPSPLARIHPRFHTPDLALLSGAVVGIAGLLSGTTAQLIILSVLGALAMYIISLLSLFRLRKSLPTMNRPVKALFYPYFPLVALSLATFFLLVMIYHNPAVSALFFGGMIAVSLAIFIHSRMTTIR